MAFKMKGHELPGPHQRKSPAKCPLLAAAPAIIGAVGALKKNKEEDSPATSPAKGKEDREKYERVSATKGDDATKTAAITEAYGGKWKVGKDKRGREMYTNETGESLIQHATRTSKGKAAKRTEASPANHTVTTGKGPGGGDYIVHTHGADDKVRQSGGTTKDIGSQHTKSKQKERTEASPAAKK